MPAKTCSFRIRDDIQKAIHIKSLETGMSRTQIVNIAICEYLKLPYPQIQSEFENRLIAMEKRIAILESLVITAP